MTRAAPGQAGLWAGAAVGSVAVHAGFLALIWVAIQPDPVTQQPMPTSELEVQAYQLDRVKAVEQPPDSQQTDANTPDGQALDAGAIPQSRARVAQPDVQALRPDKARPDVAKQITEAASVIEQTTPDSRVVALSEADITPAAPVAATVEPVSQAVPDSDPLGASPQSQTRLNPARVATANLRPAKVVSVVAASAAITGESARPVARPAFAVTALQAPQGPVVQAALPEPTAALSVAPASAPLPIASPNVAATVTLAVAANRVPLATPAVAVVSPASAPSDSLPLSPPPADSVSVARPDLASLPVSRPESDPLPLAKPAASTIAPGTPDIVATLPKRPEFAPAPPAPPNAQKLKAALAFSGGGGEVDPVSIAAFQSFMQPGDITGTGDRLRDGVAGLLAQVPCSRMQVAFDSETATLQVNGHIPEDDLRAPVLAALQAQMGANITVSDNILILPRPQCGALSGIANVGLPQSTDQITNPLVIGDDAHARVFDFAKGDLLSLDMTAPDYDAFIYLDYFDADGMVLHLEPNEYAPLRQAKAQAAQQIGAKTMQDAGLKLVIGPPYGQEIAVAFAASEPLYEGLRPIQEPAAEYLEWLQKQVANVRANNPDFKGEWVYFFVSTSEG